jgi:hypothetical protein
MTRTFRLGLTFLVLAITVLVGLVIGSLWLNPLHSL